MKTSAQLEYEQGPFSGEPCLILTLELLFLTYTLKNIHDYWISLGILNLEFLLNTENIIIVMTYWKLGKSFRRINHAMPIIFQDI